MDGIFYGKNIEGSHTKFAEQYGAVGMGIFPGVFLLLEGKTMGRAVCRDPGADDNLGMYRRTGDPGTSAVCISDTFGGIDFACAGFGRGSLTDKERK